MDRINKSTLDGAINAIHTRGTKGETKMKFFSKRFGKIINKNKIKKENDWIYRSVNKMIEKEEQRIFLIRNQKIT